MFTQVAVNAGLAEKSSISTCRLLSKLPPKTITLNTTVDDAYGCLKIDNMKNYENLKEKDYKICLFVQNVNGR